MRRLEGHDRRDAPTADDLRLVKTRLRTAERDLALDVVRRYPKTSLVLAFAAGAAFAGVPMARRFIWAAGVWTGKRALGQLIHRNA